MLYFDPLHTKWEQDLKVKYFTYLIYVEMIYY